MNFTDFHKKFMDMQEQWLEQMLEYNQNTMLLLSGKMLKHSHFTTFLQVYVQLPLSITYMGFVLFLLYVFIKEKIAGFVQIILLLTNIIVIAQMVVVAPLLLVFLGIVDENLPIPHPWCSMLIVLEAHVKTIVRTTSLYLTLLLAINRFCTIYFPFKAKMWFTRRRCIIHCLIVVAVCVVVGVLMTSTFRRFTLQPYFDEIWNRFQTYDACSVAPSVSTGTWTDQNMLSHFGELLLCLIGILGIGTCNILVITHLVKTKSKRMALIETQSQYETESRMSLLNRISIWVLLSCIICEIPSLVLYAFNFYDKVYLLTGGTDDDHRPYIEGIAVIQYVLLTPLDLVIFIALSKKARKAIKRRMCHCQHSS